jgi:hypothetical protein
MQSNDSQHKHILNFAPRMPCGALGLLKRVKGHDGPSASNLGHLARNGVVLRYGKQETPI